MLNTDESENKRFTNTLIVLLILMVTEHGACDHDRRKEIKILVTTYVGGGKKKTIKKEPYKILGLY